MRRSAARTHSGQASRPTTCSRYSAPPMMATQARNARREKKLMGLARAWRIHRYTGERPPTVVEEASGRFKPQGSSAARHPESCQAPATSRHSPADGGAGQTPGGVPHAQMPATTHGQPGVRRSSRTRPSWNNWLLRSTSPSCASRRPSSAQISALRWGQSWPPGRFRALPQSLLIRHRRPRVSSRPGSFGCSLSQPSAACNCFAGSRPRTCP